MSGIALIITFVIAIAVMILAISKWNVHPFLALMGVSLLLAIVIGLPLKDIPGVIGSGFSGIFSSIGFFCQQESEQEKVAGTTALFGRIFHPSSGQFLRKRQVLEEVETELFQQLGGEATCQPLIGISLAEGVLGVEHGGQDFTLPG